MLCIVDKNRQINCHCGILLKNLSGWGILVLIPPPAEGEYRTCN